VSSGTAPTAPGRLGEQIEPALLQTYLVQLETWVRLRRAELDEIDTAALASPQKDAVAGDVVLSMALWKSVADRYSEMWRVWDGGRVGPTERERLSTLIWGRLDAGGAAASVPEACRLSDALTSQLRARLSLSPAAAENARRVQSLRATLERLRDQVELEPAAFVGRARQTLAELEKRTEDVTVRQERGGDVGGFLGPLEQEAATFERDLIVGGARRRETRDLVAEVEQLRAGLDTRADTVRELADRTVAAVVPAPRNAVPDVDLLGPVPDDERALIAYKDRLGRVEQAIDIAEQRYADALARRGELSARLDELSERARAKGVADHPDLTAAIKTARGILDRTPTPIAVAEHLVAAAGAWLELAAPGSPRP
jgi:hypothetical protein